MSTFREALTALLSAPGVRLREVAAAAHVSPSYLCELRSGTYTNPSPEVVKALDDALQAGGSLVMAAGHTTPWTEITDRTGTAPDQATVTALTTLLDGLRRLDDQAGAAIVIPHAERLALDVRTFHRNARGELLRSALLRVSAETSALLGWLHWDASDPATGRSWFARAAEQATESDHGDLLAVIAARRSLAAWLRGDHLRAVELAGMAARRAGHPLARLHAVQFELRAAGAMGDQRRFDAAMRLIDTARTDLGATTEPDPAFLYFVRSPGWDEVQEGTALVRLGHHRRGAEVLEGSAVQLARAGYRRDAGTAWARVAAARAAAGDREGAAEATRWAVEKIGVASASTSLELQAAGTL